MYNLHHHGDNPGIVAEAGIYLQSGLCPLPLLQIKMLLHPLFWVEFEIDNKSFVRPASGYEVANCFRLNNDLTHSLARLDFFVYLIMKC